MNASCIVETDQQMTAARVYAAVHTGDPDLLRAHVRTRPVIVRASKRLPSAQ